MSTLSPGRIVHFTLPDGQCRSALVVNVPNSDQPTLANLMVFLDWHHDQAMMAHIAGITVTTAAYCPIVWCEEIPYFEQVAEEGITFNTWHWPERADQDIASDEPQMSDEHHIVWYMLDVLHSWGGEGYEGYIQACKEFPPGEHHLPPAFRAALLDVLGRITP